MLSLLLVQDEPHRQQAGALIKEYLQWINASVQRAYGLSFDIEAMLASDLRQAGKFAPPFGRFYLALDADEIAGIGGISQLTDRIGEVQRMYVRPAFRGQGIGRAILVRLIAEARQIGYQKLRLESLDFLTTAHTLYHSMGFQKIDPYVENSMSAYQADEAMQTYQAHAVFMELTL